MTLIETTTPTEDAAESLIRHILTTLQVPSVSWATKEGLVAAAVETIRDQRAGLTGQLERREQANQELADSLGKHAVANAEISLHLVSALEWIRWLTEEVIQRCNERDLAIYQAEELMWRLREQSAELEQQLMLAAQSRRAMEQQRDLLADQLDALVVTVHAAGDLAAHPPTDEALSWAYSLAVEAADVAVEERIAEARKALDLVEALR